MLRYQQQFDFFDTGKVGTCVRFINLGDILLEQGLEAVLAAIVVAVETQPGIVIVDSFRTVARTPMVPLVILNSRHSCSA